MKNTILTIYPILWLLLTFAGAKFSGKKILSKDFLSLEQSKLIRGSACIGVIIHHVTQQITGYGYSDKGPVTLFSFAGILFTAIFFFFSGYGLIFNAYNKDKYLNTFLTKRLPAVLLPFWLINLAVVLFRILFLHQRYVPEDALSDIFGLTLINSNGWFIIEIVLIYLVFFVLFDVFKKKDFALFLLCVVIILIIRFAFFRGHDPAGDKSHWFRGEWWFNSTGTFIFGMLFARFKDKITAFFNRFYAVIAPVTAVMFAVLFYVSIYTVNRYGYYGTFGIGKTVRSMLITLISQTAVCIVFTLLVLLINMRIKLGNPVLSYIGSISMELFLIHGYFVNGVFGNARISDIARFAAVFVCSIACTAAAAPLIHFITKKAVGFTGKIEIYNILPISLITKRLESLKLKDKKMLTRLIAAGLCGCVLFVLIALAGRSVVLRNEFLSEYAALKEAKPGDEVLWGRFQTDTGLGRERLHWIVMENDGKTVRLIAKEGISSSWYNQKHEPVSWEDSDIRVFINSGSFLKMFSKYELSRVRKQNSYSEDNLDPDLVSDPLNVSDSYMYYDVYLSLPTVSEITGVFPTDMERQVAITKAAEQWGANINTLSKDNNWDLKGYRSSWWWLKQDEPGVYAPIVTVDGEISEKEVNRPGGVIRPVVEVIIGE